MASQTDINRAWIRAAPLDGHDLADWRRDEFGNPIRYGSYGTTDVFGWVVDCTDQGNNLRALHWKANRANDQ